jgi:2-methylcitrate dehydratase PrpD
MKKAEPQISPMMRELSAYISSALQKPLPDDVAEKGKHHLLDTIAAMVSGSRLLPGERAIAYVRTLGGSREAQVIGTRMLTSSMNAAFANAMMAHADETDDSHVPSQTHPGCGVVPAALALAERGHRTGTHLLRAVVLGYDLCTRANLSLGPFALRAASHSAHSFGPVFGAAAAAGALAGLDATQARYLLSYTAQQTAGIDCWARDKEHVEKAFDFAGMPCRNGVAAATMVASGFTGVEDVFSGEKNFFTAYSKEPDPEAFTRDLGKRFEIVNTNIKRWSVGSPIQAALDSLSALIAEHGISDADVEKLTVTLHESGAKTVNDRTIPDISLQHLASVMLVDGTVTFVSSHDHDRMADPRILAMKQRITLIGDAELEHAPTRQAILEVGLKDGRTLHHHTKAVRGTAANPMPRAEVEAKCADLLGPVIGKRRARTLIDTIWNIDALEDACNLRPLLRGRADA